MSSCPIVVQHTKIQRTLKDWTVYSLGNVSITGSNVTLKQTPKAMLLFFGTIIHTDRHLETNRMKHSD